MPSFLFSLKVINEFKIEWNAIDETTVVWSKAHVCVCVCVCPWSDSRKVEKPVSMELGNRHIFVSIVYILLSHDYCCMSSTQRRIWHLEFFTEYLFTDWLTHWPNACVCVNKNQKCQQTIHHLYYLVYLLVHLDF